MSAPGGPSAVEASGVREGDRTPVDRLVVIDVDGTLAGPPEVEGDYSSCPPNIQLVETLRALRREGWRVALYTSRNMRTFGNNVGQITARMLPTLFEWLEAHGVPFDEVHVGKPWPGHVGFYVDDRAIRPSEFLSKSMAEVDELLQTERRLMRDHWRRVR
jgi:capsule biosynthesis phosphatase